MAIEKDLNPPCLVNPEYICHPPCLLYTVCESIFSDAVKFFGTTPEMQRQRAAEEHNNSDAAPLRKEIRDVLQAQGRLEMCLGVIRF